MGVVVVVVVFGVLVPKVNQFSLIFD